MVVRRQVATVAPPVEAERTHSVPIQNGSSITPENPTGIPGGAIVNSGTLTLTNCGLYFNDRGNNGGAIINEGGTLTLINSTLGENSANGAGGGIYNSSGTLKLNNSSFNNNEAGNMGAVDKAFFTTEALVKMSETEHI
jgi:hypothetical protein